MEKIKERTGQYEVSVRNTNNGYYEARISAKIGGGQSTRLQKGGKTIELAVLSLLIALENYILNCSNNGIITAKIDNCVSQKLVSSINNLGIVTPEITAKTLAIVNLINTINANILNTIVVPTSNNIIPFNNKQTSISVAERTDLIENNFSLGTTSKKKQEHCIIEDLAIEWLKYRKSLCEKSEDNPKPLSPKTIDTNQYRLINDILPFFKKNKILYLSQVTEDCVKALLKSIKSQHSKNKCYIVLNMLFKYAIENNKATYNPVEKVKKPPEKIETGNEYDEDDYIEPDEQDMWQDIFEQDNTDMAILFETMLLTGIRPEEGCGLKWKALDLKNNVLIINNAYKEWNIYDENMNVIGHKRGDGPLKTPQSYRSIPLNPRLRKVLLKHKKEQQEIFKKSRAIKDRHRKWSEDEYMFLGRNYHPYVSATLSHGIVKFCNKYNLKRITSYGPRHSFATFCSEKGMEEIVLMKLMGHSNFETTQKYYIKVSNKRKRLAMQEAYKVVFYERKAS